MSLAAASKVRVSLEDHWSKIQSACRKLKGDTIVMIGPTGGGKTSLIELLLNIDDIIQDKATPTIRDTDEMLRVATKDFKRLTQSPDESLDQTKSQTKGTHVYTIGGGVSILDTPGFGDTEGVTEDQRNVEKIVAAIKTIKTLRAVVIVLNGRNCRLTKSMNYVLHGITGLLSKSVKSNLILMYTNTDNMFNLHLKPDAFMKVIDPEGLLGMEVPKALTLDNPFCTLMEARGHQVAHADPDGVENMFHQIKMKHALGCAISQQRNLLVAVQGMERVKTKEFLTAWESRQKLEALFYENAAKYRTEAELLTKIGQEKKKLERVQLQKEQVADFLEETRETVDFAWHERKTSFFSCQHPACTEKCCVRLKQADMDEYESRILSPVSICQECGHQDHDHFLSTGRYLPKKKTIKIFDVEKKKQFQLAKTEEEQVQLVHDELCSQERECRETIRKLAVKIIAQLETFRNTAMLSNFHMLVASKIDVLEEQLKATEMVGSSPEERRFLDQEIAYLREKVAVIKSSPKPWEVGSIAERTDWAFSVLAVGKHQRKSTLEKRLSETAKDAAPSVQAARKIVLEWLERAGKTSMERREDRAEGRPVRRTKRDEESRFQEQLVRQQEQINAKKPKISGGGAASSSAAVAGGAGGGAASSSAAVAGGVGGGAASSSAKPKGVAGGTKKAGGGAAKRSKKQKK